MGKEKLLLLWTIAVMIVSLFAAPSSVGAMTQEEKSKLSDCIVLYIGSPNSYVNSEKAKIDVDNGKVVPIVTEGRTLVPVRFIAESLEASVDWERSTSTVTISLNGNTALLNPGKHEMVLNGVKTELDVPAQIIEDRTFLPLRRLVEDVLERNIFYDRNVIIISDKDKVFDADTDKKLIDDLIYIYGTDNAVTHISGGNTHTVALKEDGTVWMWGSCAEKNISVPEMVYGIDRVIDICAGNKFTLALENDGTVWAWGENIEEEGKYTETPIQITGLGKMTRVSAAFNGQCMALKNDGTVWQWKHDYLYNSGDARNKTRPVKVTGLSNIVDITTENDHSYAIDSDGILWTWSDGKTPEKVSGISDVIDISAGQSHVLALKKDGTVWIWKYSGQSLAYYGQTEGELTVPTQVKELSAVVAISARGGGHSMALKADGSVYVWGSSWYRDQNNYLIPIMVKELSSIREIASGHSHLIAFRNDGSMWAFGDNGNGQVGDGTFITRNKPICLTFSRNALKYEAVEEFEDNLVHEYSEQSTKAFDSLTDNIISQYGVDHYSKFIQRDLINSVLVNDTKSLLDAIQPNMEVVLSPDGKFDLPDGIQKGEYTDYVEIGDAGIIIKNVENIVIRSQLFDGFQLKKPDIKCSIEFKNSKGIILDGLNISNESTESKDFSSILSFTDCQNVYINDTAMSNNKYGIKLSKVSGMAVENSKIDACTTGIISVLDSNNIIFKGSEFIDNNVSADLISVMNCKNVLLTACEIKGNTIKSAGSDSKYQLFNVYYSDPVLIVKDTVIRDNEADYLRVYEDGVYFKDTTFDNNTFSKGIYEYESEN